MEEVKKQGMESLFCPYEQALALKELGFDEECFGWFSKEHDYKLIFGAPEYSKIFIKNGCLPTPTFSQAFRWFREKYNLHYRITYYDPIKAQKLNHADYQGGIYASAASWFDGSLYIPHDSFWKLENSPYDTYEEAELECLKKLIEIVKNNLNP